MHSKNSTLNKVDVLAVVLLVLVIAAIFYKTILLGVSISRASMLVDSDSLYSALATGKSQIYDLTISRLHVPNYFLVCRQLQNGYLPLWNPLSGTGCPMIGDIQSLVLSPLQFILSPWASLYAYNLMAILYLVLATAGTYLLARSFTLNRPASIFVSTIYTFCPFNLFWLEPMGGPSECLYPIVFWLLVRLSHRASWRACAAAAAGCAVLILSGHIQYSLWGLAFGAMLAVAMSFVYKQVRDSGKTIRLLGLILLTMLIAFLLSAPILLPFAEYLKNSDCYKTGVSAGSYQLPWQAVTFMLLHPCFGAGSPYLGSLAIWLLPLAFFTKGIKRRILTPILWLDLLAIIIMIQPWPFAALFSIPPFTWLQSRYCVPIVTLFTATLAGFGFEQCAFKLRLGFNRKTCILVLWAAVIVLIPLLLKTVHFHSTSIYLDPYLPAISIDYRSSIRDLFLIGITIAVLTARTELKHINASAISAVLICCNLGSELGVSKTSLPPQIPFAYPAVDPVPYLQSKGERILNFGRHVLMPNSNFVFGIQNLNSTNVLWPHRLLTFISESGGKLMGLGVYQIFENRLSKLIDLASVKYVVSQTPVLATNDPEPVFKTLADNFTEHNMEVRLLKASCLYDPVNHDAFGKMLWSVRDSSAKYFNYQVVVINKTGKLIWAGDNQGFGDKSQAIPNHSAAAHVYAENLMAVIPTEFACDNGFKVSVRLIDFRNGTTSKPLVLYSQSSYSSPVLPRHFKLVSERKEDHIRVYENMHALPQVYIVHNAHVAKSPDQVLKLIEATDFDPQKEVVVEEPPHNIPTFVSYSAAAPETITWKRPDFNHVEINTDLKQNGLIVLTDCYYPGWQAYVDGKPVDILCANYLFRAVCVSPGHHHVSFSYNPVSFRIGVWLSLAGVAFLLLAALWKRTKKS